MGKLSSQPRIQHFSHLHPMDLTTPSAVSPCAACKQHLAAGGHGYVYSCRACDYTLHVECAELPTLIDHPAHPSHSLTLLPRPAYPEGHFNCDACGRRGDGFSYHCAACDVDVHALCAKMPLDVVHPAHHHKLCLSFFPPYHHKGFSCDICSRLGSNHWLYRCSVCEFDAHLSCARRPSPPAVAARPQMGPTPYGPQAQMGYGPQPQMGPQYQPANRPVYAQQQPQAPQPVNGPAYMGMAQQQQPQPVNGPVYMGMAQQQPPQPVNGPMYMGMAQQQPPQPVNGPVYMDMAQQQQLQMGFVNEPNNKQQGVDMGYGNDNVGQMGGGPMAVQQQQQQPPPGGFGNQLMQQVLSGIIDGASQQIGQNLAQGFMGGGDGNGGGGGGGGGFDSSSVSVVDVGSDFNGFD